MVPAVTFKAWLTPPPLGSRAMSRDQEATADLESFRVGEVAGLEVGSGPLVLALHGWGGRPAQMASLARAMAADGYRVLIPELPGHAGGHKTDIKQAATAVSDVVGEFGMPDVVIAHSFAAMVARLAFAAGAPNDLVLIAPALDVHDALDTFGDRLQLYPWARRGLRDRLEAWDPALWPEVSSLGVEQLPGTEITIFHDPADEDTPFARSAELAAIRPSTNLEVVEGLGHSKVLADPEVLERLTAVVASRRNALRRPVVSS